MAVPGWREKLVNAHGPRVYLDPSRRALCFPIGRSWRQPWRPRLSVCFGLLAAEALIGEPVHPFTFYRKG